MSDMEQRHLGIFRFFEEVPDPRVERTEGELRMLEQLGFKVVAVHCSQTALLEWSKRPDIDIVMAKVFTPEMSRVPLAELARRVQPDMRVVLVSACAAGQDVSQWIHNGQAALLGKPLTPGSQSKVLLCQTDQRRRAIA